MGLSLRRTNRNENSSNIGSSLESSYLLSATRKHYLFIFHRLDLTLLMDLATNQQITGAAPITMDGDTQPHHESFGQHWQEQRILTIFFFHSGAASGKAARLSFQRDRKEDRGKSP